MVNLGGFNFVKKFNYKVLGENIKSDFEITGIPFVNDIANVEIVSGKIPQGSMLLGNNLKFIVLNNDEVIFNIDAWTKFYVGFGKKIIVEHYKNDVNIEPIINHLFGICFGIILMQNNRLPIHGSALVKDGIGIVISGNSGAGKSTLSCELLKYGFNFLSDDIAVTKYKDCRYYLQPGFPQQKLKAYTLTKNMIEKSYLKKVPCDNDKYILPVDSINFSDREQPLNALYEVLECNIDRVEFYEVYGVDKISILLNNIYKSVIANSLGLKEFKFKECSNIAKSIKVFRILRPANQYSVQKQAEAIMENLLA